MPHRHRAHHNGHKFGDQFAGAELCPSWTCLRRPQLSSFSCRSLLRSSVAHSSSEQCRSILLPADATSSSLLRESSCCEPCSRLPAHALPHQASSQAFLLYLNVLAPELLVPPGSTCRTQRPVTAYISHCLAYIFSLSLSLFWGFLKIFFNIFLLFPHHCIYSCQLHLNKKTLGTAGDGF